MNGLLEWLFECMACGSIERKIYPVLLGSWDDDTIVVHEIYACARCCGGLTLAFLTAKETAKESPVMLKVGTREIKTEELLSGPPISRTKKMRT